MHVLLFSGLENWKQAQQSMNSLVYYLANHVGNASRIVSKAITALYQIFSNQNGKRGLKQLFRLLFTYLILFFSNINDLIIKTAS